MIKTRADLFEAAAKMMRMCDEAGIDPIHKYEGKHYKDIVFVLGRVDKYEFPLAIVEGKLVFDLDVLYTPKGNQFRVSEKNIPSYSFRLSDCSWNPPQPKTVMVELLREDAEYLASLEKEDVIAKVRSIAFACRKALEK